MIEKTDRGWMKIGPISEGSKEFDREFWASQTGAMRVQAAWEMALLWHEMRGGTADDLRLQRPHFTIKKISG